MSVTPNAASRWATRTPMRPRPTTPTVLSVTSTPMNFERFHSPCRRVASAAGICRAAASSRATACSAALTMFDLGAEHLQDARGELFGDQDDGQARGHKGTA